MRDVAFSCDDAGAKFLCVTVHSLLKHYRGDEPLRVNVLEGYGGHSAESRKALAGIVSAFKFASLRYVDVEAAIRPYEKIILHRARSRWNVFTWSPIFVPEVLADATGNVLHLDIDMLVNADVSPLLELDLNGKLIAAVAEYGRGDPVITDAVWGKGILPEGVERYFNTGTIVFNVEACRAERTWEKLIGWYEAHYEIADRIEQDAWNALYHDRTVLLPLKWNFHDRLMKTYPGRDSDDALWQGNPPGECLQAALTPAILHFWGPKKPWRKGHRPYRWLYHAAMREIGQTPPGEPLLAPWYNLANAIVRVRIRRQLARLKDEWGRRERMKRFKRTLLAPFEWLGIGLGLAVFTFLPHRALLALCDAVSSLYWLFDSRGRRLAEKNLAVIFGARFSSARARLIIRGAYRNMTRTVGHAFWTCFRAKSRAAAVGEMSSRAAAFLAENRPAITVSAHLGCWEILSQLAYLNGHAMMSVAKDIGTHGMTRALMCARKSIGQEIISADGAFRPLMAGLRAGKSLGLLVDQSVSPRKGGVWVRFFGRPVPVSAAPAFFAAKAKSPIIVAWSRPLPGGRYRCEFIRSYAPSDARDIWALTQSIAADLESVIRRHPSAWVLNYDCFSREPTPADLAKLRERTK